MSSKAMAPNKKRKASSASASADPEIRSASSSSSSINGSGASGGKSKKSKGISSSSALAANGADGDDAAAGGYEPITLAQMRSKIMDLCRKVPTVPDGGIDPADDGAVNAWAGRMQAVIEEFNLLLCCVSAATYKWGSERSGAADQNLGVLSGELGNAQEQISNSVSTRLTNVLAPVVDLVIERTVTTKDDKTGEEIKVNHFVREKVDPSFLRLCNDILCRNAPMLRQVVLANFHKINKVIGDYSKATKKDCQNDRGFAY